MLAIVGKIGRIGVRADLNYVPARLRPGRPALPQRGLPITYWACPRQCGPIHGTVTGDPRRSEHHPVLVSSRWVSYSSSCYLTGLRCCCLQQRRCLRWCPCLYKRRRAGKRQRCHQSDRCDFQYRSPRVLQARETRLYGQTFPLTALRF
jgi:hypothetical protein